jgi:transcriptional regulator with XRE-family HTH domain
MKDAAPKLTRRIADRVRELRAARGLPLEAIARKTGVSRSMISVIERGESSPTAAVLDKLASGLGVTLSALFEESPPPSGEAPAPVSRRSDQPAWRDPASGYVRRNVTPPGTRQPMQIVEVRFPAGARVAFENVRGGQRVQQQVWILAGSMNVTVGKDRHRLATGDCLAMQLDQPTMFHNPTRKAARYAVVITADVADGVS